MSGELGCYVHLPFCPYICPYCDFVKEPWRKSRQDRYLEALLAEIRRAPVQHVKTVFFGGGTPNMIETERLTEILGEIRSRFSVADGAEISVEVNPDPGRIDMFDAYREAGVTRVSIGAQSLIESEIRTLGRAHTANDVAACVERAREAGIAAVSLDCIFAIPEQTLVSLDETIDRALALAPDHLSFYGLTIEETTPFAERFAREPGWFATNDHEAALYGRIMERLDAAGFEQYELSNYARAGRRCRHNENYWANGQYLGFGAGAASFLDGARNVNARSVDAYCERIESGASAVVDSERLTPSERLGEEIMLGLRRRDGIAIDELDRRYQVNVREIYHNEIMEFESLGLLEVAGQQHLRLTPAGKFLANDVCAAFLVMPAVPTPSAAKTERAA